MAATVKRPTDTATVPVTGARSFTPKPLNFNADYRVKSELPNEVLLTHIGCDLEAPENIRIAFNTIPDLFKGSSIVPTQDAIEGYNKNGVSILVQLTGAVEDVDTERIYPYSAHLVLKVPTAVNFDASHVQSVVEVLLGSLYDTQATQIQSRVNSLLRGALTPVDL